ncbi:MAG: hypothetical protein IKQ69_01650 [Oscillospiraceae bacterium]|nr:hypothetical protein [Oscillospiraceae bacterium]
MKIRLLTGGTPDRHGSTGSFAEEYVRGAKESGHDKGQPVSPGSLSARKIYGREAS